MVNLLGNANQLDQYSRLAALDPLDSGNKSSVEQLVEPGLRKGPHLTLKAASGFGTLSSQGPPGQGPQGLERVHIWLRKQQVVLGIRSARAHLTSDWFGAISADQQEPGWSIKCSGWWSWWGERLSIIFYHLLAETKKCSGRIIPCTKTILDFQ